MRPAVTALSLILGCVAIMAAAQDNPPLRGEPLPWGGDPPAGAARDRAADVRELGKAIFFDSGLSASKRMACATCHDPKAHFAPSNNLAVQLGGAGLNRAGSRAVPSLTYLVSVPPFTEHFYESEDDGDEGIDQGPAGGRMWDGRVNHASDQAPIPLLAANEMANASETAVVERASMAPYATRMQRLYGEQIFSDTHRAFKLMCDALEAFQESPELFNAYTSKYDAFLRGQVKLSAQEARGLLAFNDPTRGNCARCHKSQLTPAGYLPAFTDFGFVAIGVPRNESIAANSDPAYFDLGACGPARANLADRPEFCGKFRAPTLRNVASRKAFYHNGVFHTLKEAVAFYATRDTNPERWYPVGADGTVQKFNDLPAKYRGNIEVEAPFDRKPGQRPAMSDQDVADIVAFLGTLTDGYSPPRQSVNVPAKTVANAR